jgi:hypothetical protein
VRNDKREDRSRIEKRRALVAATSPKKGGRRHEGRVSRGDRGPKSTVHQAKGEMTVGCIYQHKGRSTWWIKWKAAGQWQYASSESHRREDAVRLLRLKEGDTAKGIPVTSQVGRIRHEEARDDLINYHKANGRDTKKLEARINKHLTRFFARKKMTDISVPLINAYIAKRKAEVTIIPARTKQTRHHDSGKREACRERDHQSRAGVAQTHVSPRCGHRQADDETQNKNAGRRQRASGIF